MENSVKFFSEKDDEESQRFNYQSTISFLCGCFKVNRGVFLAMFVFQSAYLGLCRQLFSGTRDQACDSKNKFVNCFHEAGLDVM